MSSFSDFTKNKPEFISADMKPAVVMIGRMNPPHVGHQMLIRKLVEMSLDKKAEPFAVIVNTNKPSDRSPLDGNTCKEYLSEMFPTLKIVVASNAYAGLQQLGESGYYPVGGVCGADRAKEYKSLVGRVFNTQLEENYESVSFDRNPDSDSDVAGVSASKVRQAALNEDYAAVSAYTGLSSAQAKTLSEKIQKWSV